MQTSSGSANSPREAAKARAASSAERPARAGEAGRDRARLDERRREQCGWADARTEPGHVHEAVRGVAVVDRARGRRLRRRRRVGDDDALVGHERSERDRGHAQPTAPLVGIVAWRRGALLAASALAATAGPTAGAAATHLC